MTSKEMGEEINKEIQDVFEYLNLLRDSGITNMFGASSYLVEQFGFEKRQAANYLILWMQSNKNEKV